MRRGGYSGFGHEAVWATDPTVSDISGRLAGFPSTAATSIAVQGRAGGRTRIATTP